jgi:hypothetical protein
MESMEGKNLEKLVLHMLRKEIARMRVPKMVKNGFNSGLPVSPVFEEDKIPKEIKNRHEAQSVPRS